MLQAFDCYRWNEHGWSCDSTGSFEARFSKHIEIYEYASSLAVVGAGIQLGPNMARILDRLGVWQDIKKHAVRIQAMKIRSMCSPYRPSLWNVVAD